ncbi:MAG: hypothetical protein LBC82_05760, partial [Oscillospiraceae bacterium]|nr:hypothetical protein [Oscillospiraceae bacterium]
MTFSTIHVQNHKKLEPKEFIKELSAYMKTKGLLPVTEEKAQYSYSFSFTENNSWLTLTEPTYEPGEETAIKTAQELAKALETNCILTGVIDSDMVILDLFDESGSKIDMAVLGSPDYGFEETIMGSRELWEPLLTPEHTWEQLLEAWNADKTFAEDILYRTETLLGIDYDS